jgi:hypothetical protein
MLFELRQYHVRPGQQKAWVECVEEERRKRLVTRLVATPRSVIQ